MKSRALVICALLAFFAPGREAQESPQSSYDWLIRGGSVVDGTGAPARPADVLIRDGRIAHVGTVDPDTLSVRSPQAGLRVWCHAR